MMKLLAAMLGVALILPAAAMAGSDDFVPGTLIPDYGRIAPVNDPRLGPETHLKVAFDISEAGEDGKINRRIETAARFLNMHYGAGVPAENMQVAIVVHGAASHDLRSEESLGAPNPNAGLIAALVAQGVTIELCGQSAAYHDITADDVLPGVTIALSAMTAHALLQQQGYTLNPF